MNGAHLYPKLIMAVFIGMVQTARAADYWGDTSLNALCEQFRPVGEGALQESLGDFLEVVAAKEGIAPSALRLVQANRLTPVLQRAADQGVGPVELFSDRQFAAGGPCALFFDHAALMAIAGEYNMHGLWMVRAPVGPQPGAFMEMKYMLLGQGKLIVGYPQAATVNVADYDIFTGKYEYQPYMAMDIINGDGNRALSGLRTLRNPSETAGPFVGPLGSEIQALKPDGQEIVVQYRIIGTAIHQYKLQKIPISARQGGK